MRTGLALRAVMFHVPVQAPLLTLCTSIFHLPVGAPTAHQAVPFLLPMRAPTAHQAVRFQLPVFTKHLLSLFTASSTRSTIGVKILPWVLAFAVKGQDVSYKYPTLSIVVSITNKINNFVRDTRVPLPPRAFFLVHTRSRDNHHLS